MKMHFRPRVTRRKNFDLVFRNLSEREGLVQSVKSTMGTNNEVKGRKGGAIQLTLAKNDKSRRV